MEKCPLTGQPCPHHKHIHVTDVTRDGATSISLCDLCAPAYLGNMEPKQPDDLLQKHGEKLLELLKQLFLAPLKKAALNPPVQPEPLAQPGCPHCGMTIPEIAKLGRLGCPHCYEFFRQELDAVLRHAHLGRTRHVGKVPKHWKDQKEAREAQAQEEAIQKQLHVDPRPLIEEQIRRLGEKMEECIKREQYEIAGQLRDAIKSLRAQLEQPPEPGPPPA